MSVAEEARIEAEERESLDIARGERARQIVEDPLWIEAWTKLRDGAIHELGQADVNDTKRLQSLTLALQTIEQHRRIMEVWITAGREAAMQQRKRDERGRAPGVVQRFAQAFR